MGVTKIRQSLVVNGSIRIGSTADVQLARTAADRLGLANGDELDLKTNTNNLRLPGGTAAFATADFGSATGRVRIGTQGGTPAIGFELSGSTFWILRGGNV